MNTAQGGPEGLLAEGDLDRQGDGLRQAPLLRGHQGLPAGGR